MPRLIAVTRSGDETAIGAYRTDFSRLSCLIAMTPALDGQRVTIAPED